MTTEEYVNGVRKLLSRIQLWSEVGPRPMHRLGVIHGVVRSALELPVPDDESELRAKVDALTKERDGMERRLNEYRRATHIIEQRMTEQQRATDKSLELMRLQRDQALADMREDCWECGGEAPLGCKPCGATGSVTLRQAYEHVTNVYLETVAKQGAPPIKANAPDVVESIGLAHLGGE